MFKVSRYAKALIFAACFAFCSQEVEAVQLTSAFTPVTGSGTYNNSTGLVVDNNIPAEWTAWTAPTNVWWYGLAPNLVIDLQQAYTIDDVILQVDNNDYYKVDYSLDNSSWNNLFYIRAADGEVGWGMDTMSTVSGDPEYISGIDFSPVNARYIKFYATGGDNMYSISELQVYGQANAVPEPATVLLLGSGFLSAAVIRRKLRKK